MMVVNYQAMRHDALHHLFQIRVRLSAAALMETQPMSLQLRYLQTLNQIAAENNSTTIFPIPIDLFKPFLKLAEKDGR